LATQRPVAGGVPPICHTAQEVDLPLTRVRHVTAVVTTRAVALLGLEIGSPVTAAFQASSVLLATLG